MEEHNTQPIYDNQDLNIMVIDIDSGKEASIIYDDMVSYYNTSSLCGVVDFIVELKKRKVSEKEIGDILSKLIC